MDNVQKWQNQPRYQSQPNPERQTEHVVRKFGATRWNFLDITMLAATVAVAIIGMLLVINVSNQTAKVNANVNQMMAELTQTKNENNDLRQEIGTLTNNEHLSQVANKENLSINHDNVRNVK
ncbi:cell division protein FtsL [Weissella uvarum]|uniref:cell division protein FtsL n=1 Tax=Weissella uvarum TaxID=1479233 RepID=UPI00195FC460|nr:cell division protein FtsL [Weissella uvarum]MBM7617795.1 cell division protein FtsL [Weissella uvarum]MCM0595826.1 cell division protein FtsL [Weissella uvarum]